MTGRRGQLLGGVVAGVWLVAILIGDLVTSGPNTVLSVFFAVAPLIACAVFGPVVTAAYGAVAVALTVASGDWDGTWGMAQHGIRIADVAVVSAVAVLVAAVRVRRERSHARLIAIADAAQRAVLPRVPARTGPLRTATRYRSAAADALIGGDFYDVYHSERWVRLVIGDVRGKGLGGVEHAARVIRAFRQSAAAGADIAAVAEEMTDYLQPFFDDEEFATAFLLGTTGDDTLSIVNCGHPPPLLVAADEWRLLESTAWLPLGLGTTYSTEKVTWARGDRLLLYTDGLIEARDRGGRFLSLEAVAGCLRQPSLEQALDAVLDTVSAYVPGGRLADDLALVLLENVGGSPALTQLHPEA